jgi:hypothetical protein
MGPKLREPSVVFSEWKPWHERSQLRLTHEPTMGVCLWAHFQGSSPSANPYPELPEELVYVGETNDVNVRPLGQRVHHRLANYRELCRDPSLANLYVAVCRVAVFRQRDQECHAWRAFTRHLEAKIAWEYTKKFGKRPLLDYKRGKDEFALQGQHAG